MASIGVHAYLLIHSGESYKKNGKMIKEIITCAKAYNANVQKLFAINLPAQIKGALMFRNGFAPALKWLAPDLRFKELYIIQPVALEQEYEIKCRTAAYESIEEQLKQFDINFNPGNDMIIWFQKDGVYFIQ